MSKLLDLFDKQFEDNVVLKQQKIIKEMEDVVTAKHALKQLAVAKDLKGFVEKFDEAFSNNFCSGWGTMEQCDELMKLYSIGAEVTCIALPHAQYIEEKAKLQADDFALLAEGQCPNTFKKEGIFFKTQ